jgi:uncharacterized membrane protein
MKKCINLIFMGILALVMSASLVNAETYYADISIEVFENGEVSITGYSNHPALQSQLTQNYTSKEKNYWLLNISPSGTFSDYVAEIRFPENAVINYLRVPNILSMAEKENHMVVTMTGTSQSFFVLAQYSINPFQQTNTEYYWISFFMIIIASGLVSYALSNRKSRKPASLPDYNPESLTIRQKQIMDLIEKHNGHISQSKLHKLTGLPKASLSRNVDALVRKGILIKEEKGMTNLISLKK